MKCGYTSVYRSGGTPDALTCQHNGSQRAQRKTVFRNATVCLKLTQQEVQLLDQLATAKGMARSEWMTDAPIGIDTITCTGSGNIGPRTITLGLS